MSINNNTNVPDKVIRKPIQFKDLLLPLYGDTIVEVFVLNTETNDIEKVSRSDLTDEETVKISNMFVTHMEIRTFKYEYGSDAALVVVLSNIVDTDTVDIDLKINMNMIPDNMKRSLLD